MASMRESDTGLWLHNKLGSAAELWAPPSIASLLTASVIDNIRLCFHGLSSPVKLKLLLGILHLPRRAVDEMKGALTEIIQLATLDPDPWVLMVADILKSFPDIGSLNLDLEEQNPNVQDILGELREKVSDCESSAMLPLECQYLNKNALTTLAGPLTPPVKHFQLKRKPKSATLRAELLQKSNETALQLKKTAGVSFHAKGRGLVKKIDTTTPLKGIPKQAPFRNPTAPIVFSPAGNRTPIPSSRVPLCKERGVKYIDIKELNNVVSGREAKRRRKTLDTDVVAKQAKEETVVENATPDYAAGLVSTQKLASLNNDPALASTSYLPAAPSAVPPSSYVPSPDPQPGEAPTILVRTPPVRTVSINTAVSLDYFCFESCVDSTETGVRSEIHKFELRLETTAGHPFRVQSWPPNTSGPTRVICQGATVCECLEVPFTQYQLSKITLVTNPAGSIREPLQVKEVKEEAASAATAAVLTPFKQRTPMYHSQSNITVAAAAPTESPVTPPVTSPATQGPPATPQEAPTKKGLRLTKEQLFAAHEIFQTANKVTRPEKALILGFMAGSRENPCQEQGDVIQIKLSEHTEVLPNTDGTGSTTMLVDTIFEMNYATGEWSRLTKYKPITNVS